MKIKAWTIAALAVAFVTAAVLSVPRLHEPSPAPEPTLPSQPTKAPTTTASPSSQTTVSLNQVQATRLLDPDPMAPSDRDHEDRGVATDHRRRVALKRLFDGVIPSATDLAASTVVNPELAELGPKNLRRLQELIDSFNQERSDLAWRESELIDQCLEDKISRDQIIPLTEQREPLRTPAGAVSFTRHENGKPPFRVLLHPGEFPELDGVRLSRRDLSRHAQTLVLDFFAP